MKITKKDWAMFFYSLAAVMCFLAIFVLGRLWWEFCVFFLILADIDVIIGTFIGRNELW